MNKIERMLQELCPEGVEYKKLGEVCVFQRGSTITAKEAIEGDVPVIAGGQKPAYYHNVANRQGKTVVVAGSGAYAGFVTYWEIPIFVSDAFSVNPHGNLDTKYLYYYLKNIQENIHATKKGSGVPHVHGSSIAKFEIPVPPLPIQEEIVRILDHFTALTAELQAELQARQEQYEYYRNKLLTFNILPPPTTSTEVRWMKMSEIAKISSGKNRNKSDVGTFPVYGSTGIIAYCENFIYAAPQILIARVGANAGFVHIAVGKYDVSDNTLIVSIEDRNKYDFKYVYYILSNMRLNKFAKGGGQPLITATDIKKLLIPIPPLAEQQRIVSILDKFDTLVNDLSQGLPAEIAAVQEQYEYYRNKLLTFKRIA